MSTQATGRVVDKDTGNGIAGLIVTLTDVSMLWKQELGTPAGNNPNTTQNDGRFNIGPYSGSGDFGGSVSSPRKIALEIRTPCHRLLWRKEQDDEDTLDFGAIQLAATEVHGFTVTLGGKASLGGGGAQPVRTGNAIQPLVDNEAAWGRLADTLLNAAASIDVMQLEFDMPPEFNAAPSQENPELVLSFDRPIDALHPRPVLDAKDYRPERLLLDKASQGKKVRVIIPEIGINWAVLAADAILVLLALFILAITDIGNFWSLVTAPSRRGSFSNVQKYFSAAGSTAVTRAFKTGMFNVVHAKMAFIDATPATADSAKLLVLSSPFSQSYYDATVDGHKVNDPRRGSATGEPIPVHDVSLAVRGPAIKDAHEAFRLHWNRDAAPADQVPEIPIPAAVTDPNPNTEYMASLQLVRSINAGAFPELPDGEKGVLEAYLRAIEMAKELIYLENQYFTNETICKALVAALNDASRPNLQIVVLFNVSPDLPFYPVWQSNLIDRIRNDAGANKNRIGFFTAWSHELPLSLGPLSDPKPMIMANYVHSKVAVVDNLWAIIGSANLDGASLDAFQLVHALQFADNRNHELNFVIQDDPANTDPDKSAVDALRRSLWSEHLGYGDTAAADIKYANKSNFLKLWNDKAQAKLTKLINSPASIAAGDGRVLSWPDDAKLGVWRTLLWPRWPFEPPEAHLLSSANVKFDNLKLIDRVLPFSFHDGIWK